MEDKKNDIKVVVNGMEVSDIVGVEFTISPDDVVANLKLQTKTSTIELDGSMKVSTTYEDKK